MATRARCRRRALEDITNNKPRRAIKVTKLDRPITRNFEANIQKNQQKIAQTTTHDKELEDYIFPRRQQSPSPDSSMSIEPSDEQTSGVDSREPLEIVMEEAESPLPDIDKDDARDPLAAAIYVEKIYSFYRKCEITCCVPLDYMPNQTEINQRMRSILVDWLVEVHHKFGLMHETLFLSITLIDRYLSRHDVPRKFLQLVGVTGLLIACKYEEIFPPPVGDFLMICDGAYVRDNILKMEMAMLSALQFNLSHPTPLPFLRRFIKAADSDTKLEMACLYLLELCMVEYQTLKYPPSMVSAAVIKAARCILRSHPIWNRCLTHHCAYTEEQLQECVVLIKQIHQSAGEGKLTAVFRKYSISKHSCISTLLKQQLW